MDLDETPGHQVLRVEAVASSLACLDTPLLASTVADILAQQSSVRED